MDRSPRDSASCGNWCYRYKTVEARANAKAQVHGVLAKQGVKVPMSDLFGVAGNVLLDAVALDDAYFIRVESLRDLVALHNREIAKAVAWCAGRRSRRPCSLAPTAG